jgi:hypothetical protein
MQVDEQQRGAMAEIDPKYTRSGGGRAVWHEHHFSPAADPEADDTAGRFDAVEDDSGAIYVLDVGANQVVARCATREEAVAVARSAAKVWGGWGGVKGWHDMTDQGPPRPQMIPAKFSDSDAAMAKWIVAGFAVIVGALLLLLGAPRIIEALH